MASLLSSILRSVNRSNQRTMNILCANHSESFQVMLAETGHNFYFLQHPKIKPWNTNVRPVPQNCHRLCGHSIAAQLKQDIQFDVVLCQSRIEQSQLLRQISNKISCPMIMAENALSIPDMNPFHVEALAAQPYDYSVFNSEFLANSWGFEDSDDDVSYVSYGIDADKFCGWKGGDGKILTMVNHYKERGNITGFENWLKIIKDMPANPRGYSSGISMPAKNYQDIVSIYRNASVFLNTSSWSICPKAMLEAMAVGCPVVSTATTIIPEIIEDGVNGFVSHDIDEIRKNLSLLLKDQSLAREMGRRGRETIQRLFSKDKFLSEWKSIFSSVAGKVACSVTGV